MTFSLFRIQIFTGENCSNFPLIPFFEKEGFKTQEEIKSLSKTAQSSPTKPLKITK